MTNNSKHSGEAGDTRITRLTEDNIGCEELGWPAKGITFIRAQIALQRGGSGELHSHTE